MSCRPSSSTSSPRSNGLLSPPDSPSSDSVSSFPSVSSSFFFSSGAASPPHPLPVSDQGTDESTQSFIIPSLTLPPRLKVSTIYGKVLGRLRLLVVTSATDPTSIIPPLFFAGNEDIVDEGYWDIDEFGAVIRASTEWNPMQATNEEPSEPAKNVEIRSVTSDCNISELTDQLRTLAMLPFELLSDVLSPRTTSSFDLLLDILSSPSTPIYTALIILTHGISATEIHLVDQLAAYFPIILVPAQSNPIRYYHSGLSSFQPASEKELRVGLFRRPDILATLRREAASRFLRWNYLRHSTHGTSYRPLRMKTFGSFPIWIPSYTKREGTAQVEWDTGLGQSDGLGHDKLEESWAPDQPNIPPMSSSGFDPLHLPSLVLYSFSVLRLWHDHLLRKLKNSVFMRMILLGGVCIGFGTGLRWVA